MLSVGAVTQSGTHSARPSPHQLSLCSFVFLQLYHSPFFGDESNKPILLPNEVGMQGPLEPGWWIHSGLPGSG